MRSAKIRSREPSQVEALVAMTGADGTCIAGSDRLITTLTDHNACPAGALIRLYHERRGLTISHNRLTDLVNGG